MRLRSLSPLLLAALLAGCGYRLVAPPSLALAPVGNATEEVRLGALLGEAFRAEGVGGGGGGTPTLQAAASRLVESPSGLTAAALPVRETLTLTVEWRVLPAGPGTPSQPLASGAETVTRSYAWDPDPVVSDRRRAAALVLLARDAARAVLLRAGRRP